MSPSLRGILMVAFGALCLSPSGLVLRLVEDANDWQATVYRSFFLAVGTAVFVSLRYRRGVLGAYRETGPRGVVCGVVLGVGLVGYSLALLWTTVANALFVVGSTPVFAALLGWLFLKERVSWVTALCIAGALAGIGIMVVDGIGGGRLAGNLAALLAAVTGASAAVLWRSMPDVDMMPSNTLAGVVAAAICALAVAGDLAISARDFWLLALAGTFQAALGMGFVAMGARYLAAAKVSLVWLLEIVLGPVWVWLVISEQPSMPTLIGGLVVLLAVLIQGANDLKGRTGPIRVLARSPRDGGAA